MYIMCSLLDCRVLVGRVGGQVFHNYCLLDESIVSDKVILIG
jgi:hypothetical protein